MTKKRNAAQQNPLDRYLDFNEDDDGLAFIARRFAETFDAASFRIGLITKLRRYTYRPAKLKGDEKTFHDILANLGVLGVLQQHKILHELWQCTLLSKVVQRARKFEQEGRAVDGRSLKELRREERQLWKDLNAIDEIVGRNNLREDAEKLSEKLDRRYRRLLILQLVSTKYKGSRAELLSGRIEEPRSKNNPRDEDVATRVAIYRVLKRELQTEKAKKKGLFDILLCQLAELISAPSDIAGLSDGTALYRAVRRSS